MPGPQPASSAPGELMAEASPSKITMAWRVLPVVALVILAAVWGREIGAAVVVLVAVLLAGSVLAAVHHADVVAHRVGEPFGSLVLAVSVTVIEVSLIVTLMLSGGDEAATLARETVFAAVMITVNGILGVSVLIGARRFDTVRFNAEGTGGALATVATLATVCLVLPTVTLGEPGPEFSTSQLAFAAVASLALYLAFVVTQTMRHREIFLPVSSNGRQLTEDTDQVGNDGELLHAGEEEPAEEERAEPPTSREAMLSLGFLLLALVAVVGLAKIESPAIEDGVLAAGLPLSFVGVVIALLVLLPEFIAAANAARDDRVQTSLNLAMGSAMASIGLTIPTLAVASIWIPTPLHLGLGPTQMVLLAITVVVAVLTVVPGRATRLQASVHLTLFAAFIFLAMFP